jgi:hypothetical protein
VYERRINPYGLMTCFGGPAGARVGVRCSFLAEGGAACFRGLAPPCTFVTAKLPLGCSLSADLAARLTGFLFDNFALITIQPPLPQLR